ncbi:MAG: hypothetical protein ACLFUR_03430 [Candidatus Hadarchaeia archaeon]
MDPSEAQERAFKNLEKLKGDLSDSEKSKLVEEAIDLIHVSGSSEVFGKPIIGFDFRDAAEAFIGALIFGIPIVLEDGVVDIGNFIARNPIVFLIMVLGSILIINNIFYFADIQNVQVTNPILV